MKRQRNDSVTSNQAQRAPKQLRARSTSGMNFLNFLLRYSCSSNLLVFKSEFRPSGRKATSAVQHNTEIKFKKSIMATHEDGNSVLLSTGTFISGLISNKPFGHGSMKVAFDVSVNRFLYF